jgi:hypothetical protein
MPTCAVYAANQPLTVNDILAECPDGCGYQKTNDLCWFVGQKSPIDEERRILAQRMRSSFLGIPDVWVAVSETHLPAAAAIKPLAEPDTCDGRHWDGVLFPPTPLTGNVWRLCGIGGAPRITFCPECGKRLAVPG